jgi:hypothetical protein
MIDEEEDLPKSLREGKIKIGDEEITVHVLDNGMRVIEEKDMERIFKWLEEGK